MTVQVYTDGACSPNPGRGGWGAVIRNPQTGATAALSGGPYPETTNNQMELIGVIEALKYIGRKGPKCVEVYTDSSYVKNGITSWIEGWKRKGWKTPAGNPVKNADLWKQLEAARAKHESVEFHWVKGHADNPYNNAADKVAVEARREQGGAPRLMAASNVI